MTILLTILASTLIGYRALDRLAVQWRRFNEWRKG